MIELNIKISNPQDLKVLLPLLKRLGLSWDQQTRYDSDIDPTKLRQLQELIAAGGDGNSIKNPLEWQRDIRKGRNLPFSSL